MRLHIHADKNTIPSFPFPPRLLLTATSKVHLAQSIAGCEVGDRGCNGGRQSRQDPPRSFGIDPCGGQDVKRESCDRDNKGWERDENPGLGYKDAALRIMCASSVVRKDEVQVRADQRGEEGGEEGAIQADEHRRNIFVVRYRFERVDETIAACRTLHQVDCEDRRESIGMPGSAQVHKLSVCLSFQRNSHSADVFLQSAVYLSGYMASSIDFHGSVATQDLGRAENHRGVAFIHDHCWLTSRRVHAPWFCILEIGVGPHDVLSAHKIRLIVILVRELPTDLKGVPAGKWPDTEVVVEANADEWICVSSEDRNSEVD